MEKQPIRGLTLYQPWASLVAGGYKCIETRSWMTNHRGYLAIHAGKRWNRALAQLCQEEPFVSYLRAMGFDQASFANRLPRGSIVAVARLTTCVPTVTLEARGEVSDQERALGDYGPARWGWLLADVQAIEPVPCRGGQQLFRLPEHGLQRVREAYWLGAHISDGGQL